jgi:hypothetical protein
LTNKLRRDDNMNGISPFQKSVGETLIDLSEFLKKINPNPFVAVAALEIYKIQIISWSIFDMDTRQSRSIMSNEVLELVSALEEFFETFEVHPIYVATALEITKNQFLNEISKAGRK